VGGNFYNSEASQRFFYYPETYAPDQGWAHWMPTVWFNGIDEQTGVWTDIDYTRSVYTGKIQSLQAFPTPLLMDLEVEYGAKADTGTVRVEVVAEDVVTFSDLHLRLAVIESGVDHSGEIFDQILRDYLPDPNGISFSIAQGDTFTHSAEFIIQGAWEVGNCDIAAFVQNDAERMVIQAVQAPVPAATPVVSETPTDGMPDRFQLCQNYPNPFNPVTEILYFIPRSEHVSLKVYNVLGAEVATLVEGKRSAGSYSVRWNAEGLASGMYFCRLQAGGVGETIKMVLMR
jgi:hypothetical protein